MLYLVLTCATLFFFCYYILNSLSYWKKRGISQYSSLTVLYSTLATLLGFKRFQDEIEANYNDFSNVRYYGSYNFNIPALTIRDPDLIKRIMVKDFDYFTDHLSFIENSGLSLWDKNIFFLRGDQWRHMRNKLSPFFTGSKMKLLFGLVSDSTKQLVRHFQDQKLDEIHVEMRDVFTRFANDVIATTAFGISCDSMKHPENDFYKMGKIVSTFGDGVWDTFRFSFVIMFPKFSKFLRMKPLNSNAFKFFENIQKENIKERRERGIVRPDMIHLLLEGNKNESGVIEKLSDDDIAAQAFVFFIAGFHSVATLMNFVAYEIAVHPEVQKRLHEEVDGLNTSSLTYEDLRKLKYLDQVISETNRKWPGFMFLDRVCVKPYTIEPTEENEKPVHIKVGDNLAIPVWALHRDPNYFPNPLFFDPSRFDDDSKTIANSFTYLPFGGGPRGCLGIRFAIMEVKLVYFYLLSNFEFTVIEKTPIPLNLWKGKFQLGCDEGFWVGLKQRKLKSQ